jgi:tetratricopeptide (TPR) repeat protein
MPVRRSCLLIVLACLTACTRDTRQTVPQLAVLRFENLSADASLDWMGRGFSEILSSELEGSPQRYAIQWHALHSFDASLGARPAVPGISAEFPGALVAGANGIVYGDFSVVDGTLHATATEEDLAAHKMLRVASASGPVSGGVFPVAESLARQFGGTHPFGTHDTPALHAYVDALEAPDPAAASQDFARATAAAPDFGRAYVLWLDAALAQRNRAQADRVIGLARARQSNLSALDRANLDFGAAVLHGDYAAQIEALRSLTQQDPADPYHHRALAQSLMNIRDYEGAIVEFRRGLSLRPDDAVALNSMGYAAAFSGDLPTAIRVLRGYEQLRPNEPNPLDSLGDVHFALGHFGEAEQFYLAAHHKAPAFLNGGEVLKAAQARLMTGDVAGATALFNRYLAARQAAHDPNAPYHAAAWSWQTGARRAAIASLDSLARDAATGAPPEVAFRADAQAAIWLLDLGDRAGAAEHARKAMAEAAPENASVAALVAFLAQPEAFPAPAQSPVKDYARAYALLYGKQFQPAAAAIEEIYRHPTDNPDDGMAVLLAWTYAETGQWQRAAPLLRLSPLPEAAGLPLFSSLYFPRLFFLRGAVLDREGHRAEAARNYQMFRALSGPDSMIWGEEERARP